MCARAFVCACVCVCVYQDVCVSLVHMRAFAYAGVYLCIMEREGGRERQAERKRD